MTSTEESPRLQEDASGGVRKRIALIAHDNRKADLLAWARFNRGTLSKHDLYGTPDAPRTPHRHGGTGLWEFPMTTLRIGGRNLPCSGGGYFRLLPYPLFRLALRRANRVSGAGLFYTHPWEIDPAQPRVAGASRLSRFRHYTGLAKTFPRLERLLRDFAWDRMDRVHAGLLGSG